MKNKFQAADEKIREKVDGFKLTDTVSGPTSKYITTDLGTFYPPDEYLNRTYNTTDKK